MKLVSHLDSLRSPSCPHSMCASSMSTSTVASSERALHAPQDTSGHMVGVGCMPLKTNRKCGRRLHVLSKICLFAAKAGEKGQVASTAFIAPRLMVHVGAACTMPALPEVHTATAHVRQTRNGLSKACAELPQPRNYSAKEISRSAARNERNRESGSLAMIPSRLR